MARYTYNPYISSSAPLTAGDIAERLYRGSKGGFYVSLDDSDNDHRMIHAASQPSSQGRDTAAFSLFSQAGEEFEVTITRKGPK